MDFFTKLFDTSDFPARWQCGTWTSGHGFLHILSDLGVWGAYLAIPCVLGYFVLRKKDMPFRTVFWLFVAFILACGTTHLMEALIFWWPAYRLAGLIKLFTAIVSWAAVLALVPIVPRALALRNPKDLEREIAERKRVEDTLVQEQYLLRCLEAKLVRAKERLEMAVRNSNIALWEQDLTNGPESGSVEWLNFWEQWGTATSGEFPTAEAAMSIVHPHDRDRLARLIESYLSGETKEFKSEHRALHGDGSYHWMLTRGGILRDAQGTPLRFSGSTVDITDLKRAEQALRESEERFRGTFENAAVGIAHIDGQERCLLANQKLADILGHSSAELVGKTLAEVVHPEDLAPNLALFVPLLRGELPSFSMEKRFVRKDSTIVWCLVTASLQRDASGQPDCCIAIVQDISERKQLEEELRASEHRFRTFVDHAIDAFFLHDEENRILDVNRQACKSLRCTRDELLGTTPLDFDPDVTHAATEDFIAKINAGEIIAFESRHRRKDGTIFPVEVKAQSFWEGGRRFTVSLARDITERKRAEEAVRESEERFRGTFENAAVGIAHLDAEGRCLRANDKLSDIIGYSQTELLGKSIADVVHPDDLAENLAMFGPLMNGDIPSFTMEKRFIRKDGTLVWAYLTVSLQRDAAGKPAYFIAVVQNISDRKRLEGELLQAKEAAEAANRAKDEFLANVSHEIRTPMNAILGMTELLLDTPLTEDQRRCLKTVQSGTDSLLGMMNDLLDFSKIEAGKLELDQADFSLRTILGDTMRVKAILAHKKGLELVCHVQPDVPDALIGDAGRLRQVLLNLVGNALKFTEEGEVVVQVEVAPDPVPEGEVGLHFTVRDTGIGISPDKQETIFRAFEQEDTLTTRKYGGTGLGLTIASRLVALMGGPISVESEPGRGSTFAFTARFGRQPHPQGPVLAPPPALLYNLPVLIVDDSATNRHILEEWLRGWQMEPATVGDGMAAMDALSHRAANGRPHALVLLDARMPDTDGLTVAEMIRDRAELAATRIILLTSGDRSAEQARIRELRIDAHLLKPVQQDELLETIYQVMSRTTDDKVTRWQGDKVSEDHQISPVTLSPSHLVTLSSSRPLHILVAEDNELSAQVLEQLLIRQGHPVRLASNGREALALAQEGGFDLLLLDVHMPELDGFQVVQAVREQERTSAGHLPIIVLTARSRKEDRERCLAAGADDFLTKPIRAADLRAAIERALKSCPAHQPSSLDLLDARLLLAACGGDTALLRSMCQSLQARVPERLAAIRDALRDQDALRLREAAHKCCGLLSEFSTVAGDLAGNLEDLAAGDQLDKASPILKRLEMIARELLRQVNGVSIETLRRQAEAADEPSTVIARRSSSVQPDIQPTGTVEPS